MTSTGVCVEYSFTDWSRRGTNHWGNAEWERFKAVIESDEKIKANQQLLTCNKFVELF